MGLFNDPAKLFNNSFPWGLGRFRPEVDLDSEGEDSFPPDLDSISVYVDEDGSVNAAEQLRLYKETDPIDGGVEHTYSKDNLFIAGLNKALTTLPIGALILYPTYNTKNVAKSPRRYWFAGISPRYQGRVRYPEDVPKGFVPCVGQVLSYSDGSSFQVTEMAPPVTSWGAWQGGRLGGLWGGGYAPGYGYLPPVRYLQRVPEGEYVDPVVEGRGSVPLDEIKPNFVWDWWWGNGD